MSTRTITALFETRSDAEHARDRLGKSGIPFTSMQLMQNSADATETEGFWSKLKHFFLPDEDRLAYEEGLRRGGTLLVASIEDEKADSAVALLESCHPIDLEKRRAEWQRTGWTGAAAASAPTAGQTRGTSQEEVIPVARERMHLGKREVHRGGVRVHSYVVEEPVSAEVPLREERVEVERRSTTQARPGGPLLKERSVEMSETGEEPVIQKEAVVEEEVVVRKRAEERKQRVDDTVRRTEVNIEKGAGERGQVPPPRAGDRPRPRH